LLVKKLKVVLSAAVRAVHVHLIFFPPVLSPFPSSFF
jgi:hypothetical protein